MFGDNTKMSHIEWLTCECQGEELAYLKGVWKVGEGKEFGGSKGTVMLGAM